MSAYGVFMISNETLSKIANVVMDFLKYRFPYFTEAKLPEWLQWFEDYKEEDLPRRLYCELRQMNIDALKVRYGSAAESMYDEEEVDDGYIFDANFDRDTEKYQAIKSIDCFLYQCLDVDNDASGWIGLYSAMEDIQHQLCYQIVKEDIGYELAKWG